MEKVRQAALARAQAPPAETVSKPEVQAAVKAFNAHVVRIPDYLHIHSSKILDALNTLDRILMDLIAHDGKSPKDTSKQACSTLRHFLSVYAARILKKICMHLNLCPWIILQALLSTVKHEE
jgi:hypothetical protein